MSHFSVAVFTQNEGKTVEELLAPFHEFECTGTVDEHVQSIDQLQEAMEEYKAYKFTRYKAPNGKLYEAYADEFYREPTEEELKQIGILGGSGCGNGLSWASKDWGDGKGYQTKIHFLPEGYEEVSVNAPEIMSLREFIEYYYSRETLTEGETPDVHGKHMWGWLRVNEAGEVIELINRTNPNAKWDWWVEGGRYGGFLLVKSEQAGSYPEAWNCSGREAIEGHAWVNSAKLSYIQWELLEQVDREKRAVYWEEAQEKSDVEKYFCYGIKKDMTKDEYINKGSEFGTFAVVWPDGHWYEKGQMGWWAAVANEDEAWDENYKERFLDKADPEWRLTIVDCHI